MPNSAPPACPSAAASQKPVAKNSSRPGSAAAGCAGNASLGRRFCNFAQSSSHNNGTAFGRMLCCKLRSSTSGGNYTRTDPVNLQRRLWNACLEGADVEYDCQNIIQSRLHRSLCLWAVELHRELALKEKWKGDRPSAPDRG